jgi:hypothetical protein
VRKGYYINRTFRPHHNSSYPSSHPTNNPNCTPYKPIINLISSKALKASFIPTSLLPALNMSKLPQLLNASPVQGQNLNTNATYAITCVYVQVLSWYICEDIQEKDPSNVRFPIVSVIIRVLASRVTGTDISGIVMLEVSFHRFLRKFKRRMLSSLGRMRMGNWYDLRPPLDIFVFGVLVTFIWFSFSSFGLVSRFDRWTFFGLRCDDI